MLKEELVGLAKKNFKEKAYGLFDWVELLIPSDELLSYKPRMLLKKVATLLEVNYKDIHYRTFCSWLRRYRIKNKTMGRKATATIEGEESNAEVSWQNFVPTDPSELKRTTNNGSILKVIKYEED